MGARTKSKKKPNLSGLKKRYPGKWLPLSLFKPDPKNPRGIDDAALETLRHKIKKYPHFLEFNRIKFDSKSNNLVRAGHQRLLALELEGFSEIPEEWTVDIAKLPKSEQEAFSLLDNVSDGYWIQDILEERFSKDLLLELGVPVVIPDTGGKSAEEDGFDPTPQREVFSALGDLYELDCVELGISHRVLCGDATNTEDIDRLMDGARADLIVTDPPYNVNYQGGTEEELQIENDNLSDSEFRDFLDRSFAAMRRAVKPGAAAYVFHADSEGENFRGSFSGSGFHLAQVLIWVKDRLVLGRQDYHWQHEPIMYGWVDGAAFGLFSPLERQTVINWRLVPGMKDDAASIEALGKLFDAKSGAPVVDFLIANSPNYNPGHMPILYGWLAKGSHNWYNDRKQTTLIEWERPSRSADHPTMKPVGLCGYLIGNSSKKGDIVLDTFAGSGATLSACQQMHRACYAMEMEPMYVDVIIRRWVRLMRGSSFTFTVTRNGKDILSEEWLYQNANA